MAVKRNITISYTEYSGTDELERDDRQLIDEAKKASLNAYAPYSEFRVGAAVRLRSGRIITGANIENAAFPSGICAERSAISHYASNYPDDPPVAIAVSAMTPEGPTDEYVSPCGSCRQVIAEEEMRTGNKIKIILTGRDRILVLESIDSLLPLQFSKLDLRPGRP